MFPVEHMAAMCIHAYLERAGQYSVAIRHAAAKLRVQG